MKKLLVSLLVLALTWPAPLAASAQEEAEVHIELSAASAILVEPFSGRVLYEKNARQRRAIASTTKIMTALVAAEISAPTEILCVHADCTKIEGTSLYLEEDEQLTMEDMLYGLLLRSGNDAAVAIAKHSAGDVRHFVSLMNRKAWELGMADTHFANPHGLDDPEHFSTAYDMALLAAAFMKVPMLREMCRTDEYISRELTTGRLRLFINNNKLLARDPRAIGIKIGWTEKAGRCLVAAGSMGNLELIAVVLDAPDLYTDVSKLFDYGFSQYEVKELIPQGKVLDIVPVAGGSAPRLALCAAASVVYPMHRREDISFSVELEVPAAVEAPVRKGQVLGRGRVVVAGRELEVPLVSARAVPANKWYRFINWVKGWWRR
ncbi:MAG: D-alanyl-D-alanine carboxypeptidase [Firmicutes bacterium]|nr:D-alanyl-D-alanine carboxypeptidase [Bacillota bacterium]HOB35153.1 D-alanyl-D-alanine carboxypeptidase family protein [Bacillota bacterium]